MHVFGAESLKSTPVSFVSYECRYALLRVYALYNIVFCFNSHIALQQALYRNESGEKLVGKVKIIRRKSLIASIRLQNALKSRILGKLLMDVIP